MRTTHNQLRAAALVAVACSGAGLAVAPAANASAAQDKLLAQLKANGNLILNPVFLLQAQIAKLNIPATYRLQRAASKNGLVTGPSTAKANFQIPDYTAVPGLPPVITASVYGSQKLEIRPNGLGPLNITIPAQAGGDANPAHPGLTAAPVTIFKDKEFVSNTSFADGGCSDFPAAAASTLGYTTPTPDDPSVAPFGLDPGVNPGSSVPPSVTAYFAAGGKDTINRTGPLSIENPTAVKTTQNLVTGALGAFTLNAKFAMNNVIRQEGRGCRQAWTGANIVTVPLKFAGKLKIAPGMTVDGKVRLGTLALATPAGQSSPVKLPACFAPYKWYTTDPTTPGGPKATSQPAASVACNADGSAVPAADGGNPAFTGIGGGITVDANATATDFNADLLIG
jgi:hypothetical protein